MNDNYIIEVKDLQKIYKVNQRDKSGIGAAFKTLFKRDYKIVEAVANISFHIQPGEIRGFIGPNGAGKSTTIKILSGVLYPSSGEVDVMGYTPWLDRETLVKRIGVVFGQKSQLWWDLPAIDAFHLNKMIYEIPDKTFKDNLDYFISALNIEDVVKKPVRQLSLGERMKCEFVCALLHEPPLVFLDEPTIGLDIYSKEAIRTYIKKINKDKGTTFIVTTHDLGDIEDLCKNITVINNGTITFDDSLENLKKYFTKKKIIDITFSQAVDPEDLKDYNIKSFNDISASIEINLEENNLREEIYKMWGALPVIDLNINNISIEEVIKSIYDKKLSHTG
ncbi:ATP-binding cassette domain-containing protein [Mobilitalea sibirica]|uniref:ATP-binding cassette domain-containing protein n=1 Tax=Mobilitalea sibirica TaxID=1462919 RepID=A0A8J7KWP8_9FIRM|nr:ATP-binding cassette domain-containing protein [Mobilitalea sibirica]MBH1941605.1 ATP-binding cassette domain-containing protein [Mobilitalea sibirica]